MIAGPSSPGVGAPVYQPAGKPSGGTSMVPSACSPSSISSESTPIAGICTRTGTERASGVAPTQVGFAGGPGATTGASPVSYTHLRAHETDSYLVCRLLLEKKK